MRLNLRLLFILFVTLALTDFFFTSPALLPLRCTIVAAVLHCPATLASRCAAPFNECFDCLGT